MSGSQFALVQEDEPDIKGDRCGNLVWFKRAILILKINAASSFTIRSE